MEKIKELIFKNPETWIHIREVARKLKISPNTARKYMLILCKKEIAEKKKDGNMLKFRANIENENYKREKLVYNLKSLYHSGIIDFLYNFYNPKAIILFGSYSRGEDLSSSDLDIAVLTNKKDRPDLTKFERVLSRKIELSLFTREEISDEFFNNLINGIVLRGYLKNE